ncbi:hypothetical protein IGI04_013937 [Brassica rapa subsp. trilocularis]|uniref:Uncharacterized protein n=1 Tax=Brassica rapa subsp. trilocularis TaxID=1813537 RepID=A0ABQ7NAW1_BRACM|nr:hypothetical protein IGI04_013937 [Brassica rapa subsp. trilocularis]
MSCGCWCAGGDGTGPGPTHVGVLSGLFSWSSGSRVFFLVSPLTPVTFCESHSLSLRFSKVARDVPALVSVVAESLLCLASIPVPVKDFLSLEPSRLVCGTEVRSVWCTGMVATVASFLLGWEAVSNAVWCCVQAESWWREQGFMLLRRRLENSRHPRQQGEPHLLGIFVNG